MRDGKKGKKGYGGGERERTFVLVLFIDHMLLIASRLKHYNV